MDKRRIDMFRGILETVEKQSKCSRLKVAALLVEDNRIISMGYNGLTSGDDDSRCNNEDCLGCADTVHAEMNAILFAAKKGIATEGTTLISSYSPCINCAKHIINAGISTVIYFNPYRNNDGVLKLMEAGINIIYYDEDYK